MSKKFVKQRWRTSEKLRFIAEKKKSEDEGTITVQSPAQPSENRTLSLPTWEVKFPPSPR